MKSLRIYDTRNTLHNARVGKINNATSIWNQAGCNLYNDTVGSFDAFATSANDNDQIQQMTLCNRRGLV